MRDPYDEDWKKGAGGSFDPRGEMTMCERNSKMTQNERLPFPTFWQKSVSLIRTLFRSGLRWLLVLFAQSELIGSKDLRAWNDLTAGFVK